MRGELSVLSRTQPDRPRSNVSSSSEEMLDVAREVGMLLGG